MTRRALFLLLTVLALQFSWSAVAAYCQHESGRAARHLGHHADAEHELAAAAQAAQHEQSPDAKQSAHAHCASCAHASLSIATLGGVAAPALAGSAPLAVITILTSHWTAPPERPQWSAAA